MDARRLQASLAFDPLHKSLGKGLIR